MSRLPHRMFVRCGHWDRIKLPTLLNHVMNVLVYSYVPTTVALKSSAGLLHFVGYVIIGWGVGVGGV